MAKMLDEEMLKNMTDDEIKKALDEKIKAGVTLPSEKEKESMSDEDKKKKVDELNNESKKREEKRKNKGVKNTAKKIGKGALKVGAGGLIGTLALTGADLLLGKVKEDNDERVMKQQEAKERYLETINSRR